MSFIFSDDRKDGRTDFPKPEMDVSCLSDGVQVVIHLHQEFDGVLYVKGRSKDEQCRRVVSIPAETEHKTETFKVAFGNCGLIHVNVSRILHYNYLILVSIILYNYCDVHCSSRW